jgi:hypothetical protein
MNAKQIGLAGLLAAFVALTGYAVYQDGLLAFVDLQAASAVQMQISVDLIIALVFAMVWMWRDAHARGISPIPYIVLTLLLGSIGLLTYAIRRQAATPPVAGEV